jgi:hypothetical protein
MEIQTMEAYLECCLSRTPYEELARRLPTILDNPVLDEAGNSILHYFAYEDRVDEIKLLVAQAVASGELDINLKNKNGETALHWASKMGSIRAASALVEGGIDLDAQDISGSTALHCAVEAAVPELIPVLVGGGCNSLIADGDGKIPLDIANENADISSDYFATQLLLERLTTVPASSRPHAGDGFQHDIKKGDIVFVHRKRPETAVVPESSNKGPDTSKHTSAAARVPSPARPSTTTVRQPISAAPLTAEEDQAMKEWKEKKKKQAEEEAKKKALRPPFYARAAMPAYPADLRMSSQTSLTTGSGSHSQHAYPATKMLKSASEPQIVTAPSVPETSSNGSDRNFFASCLRMCLLL